MIESLRTTQIAFFRFAMPSGFLGAETRYKKYSCKSPCKGKSYETICENIVSRYQTLVSSLPRETTFWHRRPKAHFMTGRTGSPVISDRLSSFSYMYTFYIINHLFGVSNAYISFRPNAVISLFVLRPLYKKTIVFFVVKKPLSDFLITNSALLSYHWIKSWLG